MDNFNHEIYDICIDCGAKYRFICNCEKKDDDLFKDKIKEVLKELEDDDE